MKNILTSFFISSPQRGERNFELSRASKLKFHFRALNCFLMEWFIIIDIRKLFCSSPAGLPYDLSLYWYQYPYSLGLPFCKMRALISEAWVWHHQHLGTLVIDASSHSTRSTYVSVLTIVAFSMERFLAICHPLHLYTMSGLQRAVRIIAALWVISFLSAVPFAVFTKIHYIPYPKSKSNRDRPTDGLSLHSHFFSHFIFSRRENPRFSVLRDAR